MVVDVLIFDGHGRKIWSGSEAESAQVLMSIPGDGSSVTAVADTEAVARCSKNDVMRAAEQLHMVSRRGVPKGFLTTLPAGNVFEESVDAFNVAHLAALDVSRIDFPLVFDSAGAAMAELIEPYHVQGRTFTLADREGLRLSYAADPNLFGWLQGRTLAHGLLPYAVYSPQPVFRNFRTGELSIQRIRQFTVPDIHILTTQDTAADRYLHALELAGESTRFWFDEDYVHVLDSVAGSRNDNEDFYARAGKAAGGITVVRRLPKQSKYYAQKSGVLVWSGYDNVMLYNLQMDDVNPPRFDIRLDSGGHPTVIHACVAMGMSRMLPLILGRGISGIARKVIPVELAPTQVSVIPLREAHAERAGEIIAQLRNAGIRAAIDNEYNRPIGARLARSNQAWQPFFTVIGDRETEQQPLIQDATRTADAMTPDEFVRLHGERIRRCAAGPLARDRRLPFIGD
ncbi:His/Gly/Thr/Pro-type tRNA ligase C-terminal domain-containing protein [Streptomyces sp. NPDC050448]|uniref:His/Gly/Thr/Pro-type tRNA ligase C-terminal domain-containing protein n=1 Tax=Streptomyces sp. NPDC050448 TaxID=3155404 RepID=UPI00341E66DD